MNPKKRITSAPHQHKVAKTPQKPARVLALLYSLGKKTREGKLVTTTCVKMARDSFFAEVKRRPIRSAAYGCQLSCRFTSEKKTTAHRHPAAATPTLFLFSFCLFFHIFTHAPLPSSEWELFQKVSSCDVMRKCPGRGFGGPGVCRP